MFASTQVQSPAFVGILFSPRMVFIIDVFRALGDFEDSYDVAALDRLEGRLAEVMDSRTAKGLVSDALLLAFGLRRERRDQLEFMPLGSRRGTMDEYRLIALIGAAYRQDRAVAMEAALALGITNRGALVALACDIANRLKIAGIPVDEPDERLLGRRDEVGSKIDLVEDQPFEFERRSLTLVIH
jgi:hypothetical protein